MRFLGLKASLMLGVELRSKKPSVSAYLVHMNNPTIFRPKFYSIVL